jgi:AcrR family transcriptional regulator
VSNEKRKYQLRKRADDMAETRRRITEATIELHGSVGPAHTTIRAVAERAGVQRHTVYRHFPTEQELFDACSSHYGTQHPLPDPGAWRAIDDPRERLTTALDELFGYFERTQAMWTNVYRDMDMPIVQATMQPMDAYFEDVVTVLSRGWRRRRALTAALRHAVSFPTWRSLVHEGGITRAQGVALVSALVEAAGSPSS